MYALIITVHIIVSIVMIGVILLQAGRGGLSETFGGSQTTIFGTRAGNFLTKATAACAILYIITCISLTIISSRRSRSIMETMPIQSAQPTK